MGSAFSVRVSHDNSGRKKGKRHAQQLSQTFLLAAICDMSTTVPGPGGLVHQQQQLGTCWMIAYLVLKPTCANPVIIEFGKDSQARPCNIISICKNRMADSVYGILHPPRTSSIARYRFHSRMHHVYSSRTYPCRMLGMKYSKHNSGEHVFVDPTS